MPYFLLNCCRIAEHVKNWCLEAQDLGKARGYQNDNETITKTITLCNKVLSDEQCPISLFQMFDFLFRFHAGNSGGNAKCAAAVCSLGRAGAGLPSIDPTCPKPLKNDKIDFPYTVYPKPLKNDNRKKR